MQGNKYPQEVLWFNFDTDEGNVILPCSCIEDWVCDRFDIETIPGWKVVLKKIAEEWLETNYKVAAAEGVVTIQ